MLTANPLVFAADKTAEANAKARKAQAEAMEDRAEANAKAKKKQADAIYDAA